MNMHIKSIALNQCNNFPKNIAKTIALFNVERQTTEKRARQNGKIIGIDENFFIFFIIVFWFWPSVLMKLKAIFWY